MGWCWPLAACSARRKKAGQEEYDGEVVWRVCVAGVILETQPHTQDSAGVQEQRTMDAAAYVVGGGEG